MNYRDLRSEEGCADAVTQRLGDAATQVWYAMEAAEEVLEREAEVYGTGLEVPGPTETRKSFVGRVLSMIVA